MTDPAERKTLTQLAGRGLECRKCGCRDFRVRDTDRGDGFIRRYRVCRNCGTVRTTTEQ